jgi:hypothetical protein
MKINYKGWIIEILSNNKVYVRNEFWTKEAYFNYTNTVGIIGLYTQDKDGKKMPNYLIKFIKDTIVKDI